VNEPKFVQIAYGQSMSDEYGLQKALYALDEHGDVWQYRVVDGCWQRLERKRWA
jgi:hypothetical protein